MYLPEHFRADDTSQLQAFMRARPLATLVTSGAGGLMATHLPTVLKADGAHGTIECHLASANPHWHDLAKANEALMMFQGIEAYITPGWYASKSEHGKVVPTWNYVAVHAYGRPEVVDEPDWKLRHVSELTQQQEAASAKPWAASDAPAAFIAG